MWEPARWLGPMNLDELGDTCHGTRAARNHCERHSSASSELAKERTHLVRQLCFIRVRNGQIVEGWNNFDFATMSTQLQPA